MKQALQGTGVRELAMARPAVARDRSASRRANLSMVLRLLRDEGPRSRARIAEDTGLPKATVSHLIAELLDGGLVREGEAERDRSAVGRPGQAVDVDGSGVHGLGAELNVDYISLLALNLRGEVTFERRTPLDVRALGPETALDAVAQLAAEGMAAVRGAGGRIVGITLATPGAVDMDAGVVKYASNIGWREVPALAGLHERLGPDTPQLHLENDAKLGALAEYVSASADNVRDLVYVTGQTGVGVGIIAGGQLLRGTGGYAGEVGHLRLVPSDEPCACGRRGCWETMVGREALLRYAADPADLVRDPTIDLGRRLAELRNRAHAGDSRTLEALSRIADHLAPGLALLADILNPRLLVLGGHFAYFGEHLIDAVTAQVHQQVMAPDAGGSEIVLSRLGLASTAQGGALLALDAVYQDPTAAMTGT
ncbi:putative NBD/HSP70 family sugar kinase [Kitasatospora sp. MAP12-15]|uniref:ROK family transcriptional regulator n=1 Tax=unclassified Kitasatospora TaxID=2633591 RepID=UPI0024739C07|nr:ROK family transcriptional regulator [Kitasatospora sp. MAP12-44]MDH6109262.1 putative NBD/HSP70 family sugar kinase [Kitasatospora sp. MAP12-44]